MSGDHGYSRYANGCRCDVCRAAKAEYVRERRAQARARALHVASIPTAPNVVESYHVVDGIKHGRTGYLEHGCRCPECKAARAHADRSRYLRLRQRAS